MILIFNKIKSKINIVLNNNRYTALLWFGLCAIAIIVEVFIKLQVHHINNYKIFKHVFVHTIRQTNLYAECHHHADVNLYGPIFAIIIAPFALLPDKVGVVLWVLANGFILYYAIRKLPISNYAQNFVLFFSLNMFFLASGWLQFNQSIIAFILLTFIFIKNNNNFWAALFIALGFFTKIYGIVGFAFIVFSKSPIKLIVSFLFWSAVIFVLPMFISSPNFVIHSYQDWALALVKKNYKNVHLAGVDAMQDISVMGLVRRIGNIPLLNSLVILIPAALMMGVQLLQYKKWQQSGYQFLLLCSVLIATVIFSTGSEGPTYIIAFPAVCLWYILFPKNRLTVILFILAFLITNFGYSDILTPYVRVHIMRKYALMALPCFLVWCAIFYQTVRGNTELRN